MSNLSLCWRSRGSFFSPEPFCFGAFFEVFFWVIFDLWDLLNFFANFFLGMLGSVVVNLWLKFYFDSLRFEWVSFIWSLSHVLVLFLFSLFPLLHWASSGTGNLGSLAPIFGTVQTHKSMSLLQQTLGRLKRQHAKIKIHPTICTDVPGCIFFFLLIRYTYA